MTQIQKYFDKRQLLIEQYAKGDTDKTEFLQQNLDLVRGMNIKPFINAQTTEQCLYNYQYYNAFAKVTKSMCGKKNISQKKLLAYANKTKYFYIKKDNAAFQALVMLNFKIYKAYFIKTRSKKLSGRLCEILTDDKENGIVLHTTNRKIISLLREHNVFSEKTRFSVIDEYINQNY